MTESAHIAVLSSMKDFSNEICFCYTINCNRSGHSVIALMIIRLFE